MKDDEFYKKFYGENRVAVLQYKSLRNNFNKMVNNVLGDDYYNMGADLYECDRICCEDVTISANGFFKSVFKWIKQKRDI